MLYTKIRKRQKSGQQNLFPDFKPFMPEDYQMYTDYISRFPQHCDFTLNNLLIWIAAGETLEYAWLNQNLVLRINYSLFLDTSSGPWYTVLGSNEPDRTLHELFAYPPLKELSLVPDYFADLLKRPEKYDIRPDESNSDYVIDIERLLNKKGKTYENFRYQVNHFLKHHSADAILREVDISTPKGINELINALHSWPVISSFTGDGNDPLRKDAQAIDKLLGIQSTLPVKHQAIGLYINNCLEGFSIFHIPPSEYSIAMGNHIKFNGEYDRLFDFLVYATASSLWSQGVKLLNAEQDMGIPGIRHHKQALGPVGFYRKYTISPKDTKPQSRRRRSFFGLTFA